jgi:hypothetical protein
MQILPQWPFPPRYPSCADSQGEHLPLDAGLVSPFAALWQLSNSRDASTQEFKPAGRAFRIG